MARSAPKKRKGVYHRTMVWLGWRRDKDGNLIPDAREKDGKSSSKRKAPKAPSKTYDDDFGAAWTDNTVAKMIVDEVEAMMAKHALAPKPPPPPILPATYDEDPPLKPFERRPKPARWMEAPDVSAAINVRSPKDTFVTSKHATSKHVKCDPTDPNAKPPLAERDFHKYPPGSGVVYGGPSFGKYAKQPTSTSSGSGGASVGDERVDESDSQRAKKVKSASLHTLSAASNAAQFCVVVIALSFAPLLADLARSVMRPESKTVVAASLLRWALTAGATLAMGFVAFTVCRKPFARWLMRVATKTGVSEEGANVAAVGIAFFTGLMGAALTQAAASAIKWLLRGRGWNVFLSSVLLATLTPMYMEWRKRRRALLKRALTACYDVEKSPEGLAALMGAPDAKRDPSAFVMGVSESPGWARFREDELADWLNAFLARLWPFVNRSVCALVRAQVEPLLEEHRPSTFKRIHFEKLDLGPEPIHVNAVRWVGERSDGMGASIELDLAWSGRAKIQLDADTYVGTKIAIGVKDVEAYTKAVVTLQPLTPTLCPFGGLMITLSEKPTLEFDVDLPLGLEGTVSSSIQDWLETLVENILETTLVWPERLVVPIADPESLVTLPDGSTKTHQWYVENVLKLRDVGLVCLRVVRAENVVGTDVLSKADARVRAKTKGLRWTYTDVVNNSNDPVFNTTLYVLVDDPNERFLTIGVQDADGAEQGGFGRDALIAETKVGLSEFASRPHATIERWIEFPQTAKRNAAKKSRPPMKVLCEVTYVPFDLDGSNDSSAKNTHASESQMGLVGVGMLTARVLRGVGLKGADNGGKSSDPFCKLAMRKANVGSSNAGSPSNKDLIRHKTRTCEKTLDPEWNESFEFVGVRADSALVVDVFDRDKGYVAGTSKESLGSFEVQPLKDIVAFAGKRRAGMEKTSVTRTFALKGDASVKGGIEMELTWQPFAAE